MYVRCMSTGVVDGIMGMKAGEERSLTETVGGAWWEPDGLQNVAVRSEVVLREVFEWDVPEVRILPSPQLNYTVCTCILHLHKKRLPLAVWKSCSLCMACMFGCSPVPSVGAAECVSPKNSAPAGIEVDTLGYFEASAACLHCSHKSPGIALQSSHLCLLLI